MQILTLNYLMNESFCFEKNPQITIIRSLTLSIHLSILQNENEKNKNQLHIQ